MGLRCLIGHDYGEPQTEEQREERGDDVVVTVQEFKTCTRCGRKRILSENTEVRRTAPPGADAGGDGGPDAAGDEQSQWSEPADAEGASATTGGAGAGGDSSEFEDVSAEDDDGVILEDDDGAPERERGAWPETETADADAADDPEEWPDDHEPTREAPEDDHEDWPDDHEEADGGADEYEDWPDDHESPEGDAEADHEAWPDDHGDEAGDEAAEHTDWPTVEGDDEGFDAEHSPGGPDESVDFGGGLSPERSGESTGEADETIEATGESAGGSPGGTAADSTGSSGSAGSEQGGSAAGIRRAEPGPSPTSRQRSADPDATFVCPRCGHTAPAHGSSLRPGDICPECQAGYLTEQQ